MANLKSEIKFPIVFKLILIISGILLFTILTLATGIYLENKNILKDRISSDLVLLARSKSGQITTLLESDLEAATLVAARINIKRGLTKIMREGYAEQNTIAELTLALEIVSDTLPFLKQISIADANGKAVVSTSPTDAGKDLSSETWFQYGKVKPSFINIYHSGSEILYDVSCPVFDEKKEKLIGVIKMSIGADRLFNLLKDWEGLGKTGEFVLGKRVGNDLLFLNPLRHNPQAALSLKIPVESALAVPIEYATEKKTGIVVDIDYNGQKVLAAYTYIPLADWGFVAKINLSEAFAPILALYGRTIIFGSLVFLVSLFIVYFFSKKISEPITKLYKATEAVSSGRLNARVDIHTRDEIGRLADAFNQMVSRRVAEELKKDNEQLKRIDQLKSQFVSSVSHEFKSPLTVIKDAVKLVLEGEVGNINPTQKEMLDSAQKHTDRLIRLVNDLLELSKIEAGRIELKKEEINIATLTDGILKDYRLELLKRRLVLEKEIAQDVGLLQADKDRLSEVIINLLDNAIKYSPKGGKIVIRLSGDKDTIRFEVSDSGPGIAKEGLDKVFDKFERVTAGKQEGAGLGLPIAKDIVNLHNGKIWVESELQKGSKFIFVLPRAKLINV